MRLLLGFGTWGAPVDSVTHFLVGSASLRVSPPSEHLSSPSIWGPGGPGRDTSQHRPLGGAVGVSYSSWKLLSFYDEHPGASQGPHGRSAPWSHVQMEVLSPGLAHLGDGCAPWEGPWPTQTPVPGPLRCFYRQWILGVGRLDGFVWPRSGETQSVKGRGWCHPARGHVPTSGAAARPARSCAWSPGLAAVGWAGCPLCRPTWYSRGGTHAPLPPTRAGPGGTHASALTRLSPAGWSSPTSAPTPSSSRR